MEAKTTILRETPPKPNAYLEVTTETEAKWSAARRERGGPELTVVTGLEERVVRLLIGAASGKQTRQDHLESCEPGEYIYPVSVEVKTKKILGGQFNGKSERGGSYSGTRQFSRARIVAEPLDERRGAVVLVQMLMTNREGGAWVPETWPLSHFLAQAGDGEEIFQQIEAGVK